jgi:hypothetical protein
MKGQTSMSKMHVTLYQGSKSVAKTSSRLLARTRTLLGKNEKKRWKEQKQTSLPEITSRMETPSQVGISQERLVAENVVVFTPGI